MSGHAHGLIDHNHPLLPFDKDLANRVASITIGADSAAPCPSDRGINQNKFIHKINFMRTTTLQSSKASSSLWKLFAALLLVWILVPIGQASAQNKATENNGTENTIGGVDNLYGIDPSSTYCTNGTNETNGDKIVCLYNVGAKKFLSIGGKWGTHASLNVSPYSIYMRWNSGSSTYFLQNKVEGSGTGQYMGIFKDKDGVNGVFMDRKENCAITFEPAEGYSETNKVYLVT